jgi:hypothetical protein
MTPISIVFDSVREFYLGVIQAAIVALHFDPTFCLIVFLPLTSIHMILGYFLPNAQFVRSAFTGVSGLVTVLTIWFENCHSAMTGLAWSACVMSFFVFVLLNEGLDLEIRWWLDRVDWSIFVLILVLVSAPIDESSSYSRLRGSAVERDTTSCLDDFRMGELDDPGLGVPVLADDSS